MSLRNAKGKAKVSYAPLPVGTSSASVATPLDAGTELDPFAAAPSTPMTIPDNLMGTRMFPNQQPETVAIPIGAPEAEPVKPVATLSLDQKATELQLFHALMVSNHSLAEQLLAKLRSKEELGPSYGTEAPGKCSPLVHLAATNLTTETRATRGRVQEVTDTIYMYNPHEGVLKWLLTHGFSIGAIVNDVIKNCAKVRFTKGILTDGSPVQMVDPAAFDMHHDIIRILIERTDVGLIEDDILVRMYEYAPIVCEKLIERGLKPTKMLKVPGTNDDNGAETLRPFAWHIMRVACLNVIESTSQQSYAIRFFRAIKNSADFQHLPEYFEGCNNLTIINELCMNSIFLNLMKLPIEALEGRYLIESISDDRVQGVLRQRGSPDPKMSLYDPILAANEQLLRPVLNIQKSTGPEGLNVRSPEDYTLFGHALLHGNYTPQHLQCLKIIAAEVGSFAFLPSVMSDPRLRLEWTPLHIAFHRFDIAALKLSQEREQLRAQYKIPQGAPEPPIEVNYGTLAEIPSADGSAQMKIIEWLYQHCGGHFALDRYRRTPLMCLPMSDEWMGTEGIKAIRYILDTFLPIELRLLHERCGVNISDAAFRDIFFKWRSKESKDMKKAFAVRAKHVTQQTIATMFPWAAI
jgi:hypothetical protein